MTQKIILASASPRRRQLLKDAGIQFESVKSSYIENNSIDLPPIDFVLNHAIGKAKGVLHNYKEGIILGADTIVVIGQEIIGKPKDAKDAKRILKKLSGKTHQVITGFAIIDAKTKKMAAKAVTTLVTFKKISDAEIAYWLQAEDYMDKAGAYSFQGEAKAFITKVEGSESNVVGLPMDEFLKELNLFLGK